jgi:hypothetical protein
MAGHIIGSHLALNDWIVPTYVRTSVKDQIDQPMDTLSPTLNRHSYVQTSSRLATSCISRYASTDVANTKRKVNELEETIIFDICPYQLKQTNISYKYHVICFLMHDGIDFWHKFNRLSYLKCLHNYHLFCCELFCHWIYFEYNLYIMICTKILIKMNNQICIKKSTASSIRKQNRESTN